MTTPKTHPGIEVKGDLTNGVFVTINGRQRIRAVRDTVARHLGDCDPDNLDLVRLQNAVGEDRDQVVLDPVDDEGDATDLAALLSDVRNGDDSAPSKAADALVWAQRKMRTCPECDGVGEVEDYRTRGKS